ncbi:hypothetical protein HCN44_002901 [Aphidius gifuensis]|uniref:Peptidase M3A/M3B catalytic domain-containing protein n=1 Tax=Aphidius gifuensis TaxID=684658 RepID=A0A835CQ41_APHGI|nr:mitochondrial intermediate peptidase [Aphidius gifuensis]KAF7991339.1 hypothetical protein HCN44_002901 [Aphidius gifuensis]
MLNILQKNIIKSRNVNTWSSLAKAFNAKTIEKFDINSTKKYNGLFGIPELIRVEGFDDLKNQVIDDTNRLINEATGSTRNRKMVQIFDDLSDSLCRVADLSEFIRSAHPDKSYADAALDTCLTVSGTVEKLNTHRKLYESLDRVVKHGDIVETTQVDDYVAKLFLFDCEQCGIHLPENIRQEIVYLNDYILQIGQQFMAGAAAPRRPIKTQLLPQYIRQYFSNDEGEIAINGLYTDTPNALAREAAYKIFLYPDEEQEYLLKELINSRDRVAKICGLNLLCKKGKSTVETPEVVNDFLNILNNQLKDKTLKDFDEMYKMKKMESSLNQGLMIWDINYLTSKAKKSWLNTTSSEFTPYFSLGSCMDGLNILTQSLYGITLESVPVDIDSGEIWADNVQKLAVICEKDGLLGHIYCDFYDRPGKPGNDCHFTIRGGRLLADGTYQNPIVVMMLSLPVPMNKSQPCLLTPSSVNTLFHEMGHALHSMLARTQYQHVTGTRCSTDFAEVPSILMEYFASDPRVIKLFAKHYETHEVIPDKLLDKLCASNSIFSASELQMQVFQSMLDHVYYLNSLEQPSTNILKDIQQNYYGLPYVENTAWQHRFSHLVSYGAKYYSYLISRSIASWIWQIYFKNDPLSRCSGEKYRRECLAHGGGKHPSKVVSDFLNEKTSPANFAKPLINEVEEKNHFIETIKNTNIK